MAMEPSQKSVHNGGVRDNYQTFLDEMVATHPLFKN